MPILKRYEAVTFRRPMQRGLTRPFLVSALPEEGGDAIDLVVKPRAGYGDRPQLYSRRYIVLFLLES